MAFDRTAWFLAHKKEKQAYDRGYRAGRPLRDAINQRAGHLRRKYGISLADYEKMCAFQNNCCAICGSTRVGGKQKFWHIDHNHRTAKVRGLLCYHCNTGMGNLKDDPAILAAAISYLRSHE